MRQIEDTRDQGMAPPAPAETLASQVQLRDSLHVLLRRRRLVLFILASSVAAAAVLAATATPVFEARTKLLIEPEVPRVVTFGDVVGRDSARPDYYETQYQVLRSRMLAKKTVQQLNLWHHPELAEQTALPAGDDTAAQSRTIDRFLARLTIAPRPTSRIVDIVWRSGDPALAAKVVNTLAAAYIDENRDYRFSASKDASNWLARQLDEQRERVMASELALQRYREQADLLDLPDRQSIAGQKLADLTAAVTQARTARIRKEAACKRLEAVQLAGNGVDAVPEILSNQYIQQLKGELATLQRQRSQTSERLGPEHPEMLTLAAGIAAAEAKLKVELTNMIDAARNAYLAAEAEERALESAVEAQKREALNDSRKAIDIDVLQRNLASDRQMFEALLQREKETGISGELKASNIRLLDAAEVPLVPVWPRKPLILLLGAFVGALLAALGAFAAEHLDDRLRCADDVRKNLGLQPLGLIPLLPEAETHSLRPALSAATPSLVEEMFQFVRANALSSSEASRRLFLVTSAGSGEGKTVVASNLAAAISHSGDRVLLVDADMRSPAIHHMFELPQSPGLSDVLRGTAAPEDALYASGVPDLWIMPAGSVAGRPADLLASQRFAELCHALAHRFAWVVIDSPPSLAVVDASLIARAGSVVLFVLRADRTRRRAAQAALDQLGTAGARVAGAVLNRAVVGSEVYPYAHSGHAAP